MKEILQHEEDKHLVVTPTHGEMVILQEVLDNMLQHVRRQMYQELRSQGLSHSEIEFIDRHDKPQKNELRDKIFSREAKHVEMPAGWRQRYQLLKDEINVKIFALQTGYDAITTDRLTMLRTMTYSIPTCGGSSGSMVRSYHVKDGRRTEYTATHCAGPGGGQ